MQTTEIYTLQGLSFKVRAGTWDEGIVNEVIGGNPYSWLIDRIEPGQVVLDVGAHIGSFSIWAASRGAQVYAFEPVTSNYELLVDNIRLNGLAHRVTPFKQAMWSMTTQKLIPILSDNTGGSGLLWNLANGTPAEPVECIGLLEFMRAHDLSHCRGLKLDCEGSEYAILELLSPADLQRFDVISMECHPIDGRDPLHMTAFLRSAGFFVQHNPITVGQPEALSTIQAVPASFLSHYVRRLRTRTPIQVQVDLAASPYIRIPVLGHLWRRLRRAAHELVVFYINRVSRKQADADQDLAWALEVLCGTLDLPSTENSSERV